VSSQTTRLMAATTAAVIAGTALVALPVTQAPASAKTHVMVKDAKRAAELRQRVVTIAKRQAGERYVTGATGPGAFDCSGLVVFSYRKAMGITLPRTSYMQRDRLEPVAKKHRQPGDIVVVHRGGHVGIYVGHNRIVNASTPATGVKYTTLSGSYGRQVSGYRRVVVAH
jgi:cell wall-associated NlpC family hydrolase